MSSSTRDWYDREDERIAHEEEARLTQLRETPRSARVARIKELMTELNKELKHLAETEQKHVEITVSEKTYLHHSRPKTVKYPYVFGLKLISDAELL